MKPTRPASLLTLAALLFVAGCGGGLSEVTGNVTLDGKPVKGLEVRFDPKPPNRGTSAMGYTQADGSYKLFYPGDKTGAPAGEYTVHISGGENDPDGGKPVRVAKKFNSQSELTATVTSGANTIDFAVTSK